MCTLEIVTRNRESVQIRKLSEHRDYILSLWERASREVLETEALLEEHQREEKFLRGELDRITAEIGTKRKADEMEMATAALPAAAEAEVGHPSES